MEWDGEDRAKLVAWLLESGSKCPSCGTAQWEWEEDRYAYEPATVQCHGCYLKEVFQETDETLPGSRVVLLPKEAAEAARHRGSRLPGGH